MRTVSLRLADMEKVRIPIGLVGENLATRIIIDCKKIYEQYPFAAAALTVKPPFGDPFPAIVVHEDDFVYWDVTNTALTEDGEGEIQLSFTSDAKEIRSERATTIIRKSLIPTGSVPDAIDDFLARASAAVSLIPETINAALQEAKDSGEFDGFSPTATISQDDREVIIEITDKNGTTTSRFYMISNYTELGNKPSINNVVLDGNKSASDFGITMIPPGGTPGQYLTKASNTDYDIEWATETGETINYSNLQNKPQIAGVTLVGDKSLNDFGIASKDEVNAKADKTGTVLNTTLSMGRTPESMVGAHSTALGNDVTANANNMHAEGMHNIPDTVYPAWQSGHHYSIGDTVTNPDGVGVVCRTTNSDASYNSNKWALVDDRGSNSSEKTAFVIGNGTNEYKSNAMRVDWNGNEYISGDMYVSSNNTATSGIKVATVEDVQDSVSGIELYVDQISAELGEDINRKANKTDTVLNTTLSMGRKAGTTIGTNSTALGNDVEASGSYSHAEGYQAIARGQMSHAEGNGSIASGTGAHSEGYHTTASASYSHAEGYGTSADGSSAHAEGINTVASGSYSHAEGHTTTANHLAQHVFGQSNVPDSSSSSASTRGNYVEIVGNGTAANPSNARTLDWNGNERLAGEVYVNCNGNSTGGTRLAKITEIPDIPDLSEFITEDEKGIANGVAELDQNGKIPSSQLPSYVDDVVEYDSINVFPETGESGKIYVAKDTNVTYRWSGTTYVVIGTDLTLGETSNTAYRGDRGKAAYDAAVVNPDAAPTANSTNLVQSGGVYSALATKYEKPAGGIPASDLASGVIPSVPVQDVQVNETSIVSNGIANIQKASSSNLGVVGIEPQSGVDITSSGKLEINPASTADIKNGENTNKPIVPFKQEVAAFYGLAKAAGDSTQSTSSNAVGTYTSEAKTAIQTMLGVSPASDVAAKYTKPAGGIPASDLASGVIPSVPVQDVQVDGASILSNGVANVPIASNSSLGAVKIDTQYGIKINANSGILQINTASDSQIKNPSGALPSYQPITVAKTAQATFYGLAKAAGDTTQAQSSNAVGTYTDDAKAAIRQMINATSGDVVAIQSTQPTSSDNKLWINTANSSTGIQIPTYAEHQALATEIAPDYSNLTFPVAEGKLCTHEDKLYKANQAIATSEAWTAAHWMETTIEDELQNSGSGTMFVTVTSEEVSGEEVFSADKTVAEIKAAIIADKNVVVLIRNSAGQSDYERGYYTLDHITETSGHTTIVFIRTPGESVEAVVFESQSGMQNDSIIIAENILITNLEAVAPYYQDLSFPILQGTLCLSEDHVLYKANQNINSQEDFDPLHWDLTNIASELQNGSGKFVITISTERPRGGTRSNPTLYSDKSSADIWEAIDAGKVIMIADVTDDDYNGDAVSALVDANCDRNNGYITLSTRPSTERNIHYTIGLDPYQPQDVQKILDFNVIAYGDGTCNLIDDTAGEGTTDLVWSADKSYAEVSGLSNAIQAKATVSGTPSDGDVLTYDETEQAYVPTPLSIGGDLPTEETAQELLEYEKHNAGLTDSALAVIGAIFDNMPQDDVAEDILHSLELECERLNMIYDGWIAERGA